MTARIALDTRRVLAKAVAIECANAVQCSAPASAFAASVRT